MATIVKYDNGLKRIEFVLAPNGPRQTLRLGRVSQKLAGGWLDRIHAIIADKLANRPHDAELSQWLGGLDEVMLKRMRACGLADGVGLTHITLGKFLEQFFDQLPGKQSTRTFYGHTRRNLEVFMGKDTLLRSIDIKKAEEWRKWLEVEEELSGATIARRVKAARTIFRTAVRWKMAGDNPFKDLKAGSQTNEARKQFIPVDVIEQVIDACPDAEWRVIVALARYAGLRTPSETMALRWQDIDFVRGVMLVRCPKLEHNERFATRLVPLFPEVRQYLEDLKELAEPNAVFVITHNRLGSLNLRTRFEKIIERAKVQKWPRLFHNLRASLETELVRQYDLATVCRWIGNSPEIAARHYMTSQDIAGDFRRAAGMPNEAQQKTQWSADTVECQRVTSEPEKPQNAVEIGKLVTCGQSEAFAVKGDTWAMRDSNPRHPRCKHGALTN